MRSLPVLLLLAACSEPFVDRVESVSIDGGEGEGEDAFSSYCESLAPIFCPFYLRCGRMNVDDEGQCLRAFANSCEPLFEARFKPLAQSGFLALSDEGLAQCAAHVQQATCDEQFLELSGPCANVWQGTVGVGGPCGLDAESFVCAPGTSCVLDLSFCGTCETVLGLGAPCRDVDGTCGPAAACTDDGCVVRPQVNEACDDTIPCVLPARCTAVEGGNVCREPAVVAVGDACDANNRCPYRSRCSEGVCVETVGPGGPCSADIDCDAGFCADGRCEKLFGEGQACDVDEQCAVACEDPEAFCTSFPLTCL